MTKDDVELIEHPPVSDECIVAFEAHMAPLFDLTRYEGWSNTTRYKHEHIQSLWDGWRAAWANRSARVAELAGERDSWKAKSVALERAVVDQRGSLSRAVAAESELTTLRARADGETEALLRPLRNILMINRVRAVMTEVAPLWLEDADRMLEAAIDRQARKGESMSATLDAPDMPDIGAALASSAGLSGWTYRDLPNMLPEYWDRIMVAAGEGQIKVLVCSERTWPDGAKTRRGQVLISPEGMNGIARLVEEVKAENAARPAR